ncbi:MAG: CgeB family protein, partial [Terracidiphilus sp.]
RLGIHVPSTGPEFEAALRKRIGIRAERLGWPKRRGDLHIFLVYSLCNWEAILPTALSPFGKVTAFEWRSRGFDESAPGWLGRRESMNRALLEAFRAAADVRPVDVVVTYASGYTMSPEIYLSMAAQGAVTTNFCFDDKVRWPGPKQGARYSSTAALARAVDLNLTSDPEGTLKYAVEGGLAMFHAEAADPDLFRPAPAQFEYDVSFVGARFGWRTILMDGLRRHGINVSCFGNGWQNGPVENEEMSAIYARSRINLGCGGIGYSRNLLCLKGRDFEVPMSGALYLTQHNPELSLVFDIGREIITYNDVSDCARAIGTLLRDEDRASAIRTAARARCLLDHTYAVRWTRALRTLGALE